MTNRVSVQPGRAQDMVVKNVNSAYFHDRVVYNIVVNVSEVEKAYTWKQWLTDSDRCKSVLPGMTFADVVKQNTLGMKSFRHEKLQVFIQSLKIY